MIERISDDEILEWWEMYEDALAKINLGDADIRFDKHLPYIGVLQHNKKIKRPKIVQSGRQRAQDRMATARWRFTVREDLKRSGIM